MRKTLLKLFFLIFAVLLLSNPVRAADEFRTEFNVTYDIKPNAETYVTQNIEVTNLKSDVIAKKYSLTVKQMAIYDVRAVDQRGEMEIVKNIEGDETTIDVLFNENIIGENRTNKFTLTYKTKDIASKIGEIYTVRIPKVADLDVIREYKIKLVVPNQLGPNIFITPEPKLTSDKSELKEYTFDKESLEQKGISASFGKYQILNYKLIYQLKNDTVLTNVQEIALPPDIKNIQQVKHKSLNPQPYKVKTDKDGNLIASYIVKPKSELEVELTGSTRLLGRQINPQLGGSFEEIPKKLVDRYTISQKYWEVDAPEIQNLKSRMFDKELSVAQNAQIVYSFVVNSLNYDFETVQNDYLERHGAISALNKEAPTACMEFTDLFITLARAMGIPARELNGYAVNIYEKSDLPLSIKLKSGDYLHAWPEYYDPNFGWVPVDPTWGSTSQLDFFSKLDNSHFVFAIKGLNSEHPLPAGLYRKDDSKKLVSVDIAQSEEDFKHEIVLKKKLSLNPFYLIFGRGKYVAYNHGGTYIYNFEGHDLLPHQVMKVTLPKNIEKLQYEDLNGNLQTQSVVLIKENPTRKFVNPIKLIFSLVAGLGLCSFAYYLLVARGYRKKLPDLLQNLPRAPGQKRNQN